MTNTGPIVIKIGGSTLGSEDTTMDDVVALQRSGQQVIVVHGGGAMITDWLTRLAVPSEFVDGLRSTSAGALEVVVAVLRGVINTQLVAEIGERGGRAVGLCGVDGDFIRAICETGAIPVIAPIGLEPPAQPLNINADTVAGEVARAVQASRLVFLTDVDGLLDASQQLIPRLNPERAGALRTDGTIGGGMIPKVEACLRAAETGALAHMANGTTAGTLRRLIEGAPLGTLVEA